MKAKPLSFHGRPKSNKINRCEFEFTAVFLYLLQFAIFFIGDFDNPAVLEAVGK